MLSRTSHKGKYRVLGVSGLAMLGFTALTAFAQLPTGTILGVVRDASGATVPGATITVHSADTNATQTAVVGEDGAFRIPALRVGTYDVKAGKQGFKTVTQTGLLVEVAEPAVVNFRLDVGAASESVQVTAEVQSVETTSSSLGGLVNERKISELPLNGRNFVDLSLLQTGVTLVSQGVSNTTGTGGTKFSSNGAPVYSNNFLLDGAPMMNVFGASPGSIIATTLGVDGILEYKVVTNTFGADYGMTMGSQMVIVSKGGSNGFHGDVFEFLRNSSLDAKNYFDTAASSGGRRLPPFRRNNFGGALGGPIRKDKTFFFGVYEGLRQRVGQTNIANVLAVGCHGPQGAIITNIACPQLGATPQVTIGRNPTTGVVSPVAPFLALIPNPNTGTGQYTTPFTQPVAEDYAQFRLDQSFSQKDTAFVRYTYDQSSLINSTAYLLYLNPQEGRNQYVTVSENHVFSPALLNTARLSFSRTFVFADTLQQATNSTGAPVSAPAFIGGQPLGTVGIQGITGYGPDGNAPLLGVQNIFTGGDDVYFTRGRHALKFGVLANYYQQHERLHFQFKGNANFSSVANFLQGIPQQLQGSLPGSDQGSFYIYNTYGTYIQDDFRAARRLTLNLGLRYEFMTTINARHNHSAALRNPLDATFTLGPPAVNPSLKNFSPRVGFAWDVTGDGKTSIRSGAALLYDIGNFGQALFFGISGQPPQFQNPYVVSNPGSFTTPFTIPASAVGASIKNVDYNIEQPKILQYNFSVQRQLPLGTVMALTYTGSRGYNLWQDVEANPVAAPQRAAITKNAAGQLVGCNGTSSTSLFIPADRSEGTPCWLTNTTACQSIVPSCRSNRNFASVVSFATKADSWYNSLQVGLSRRLSHGLEFQSSYTYGKLLDTIQGQAADGGCCTLDPLSPQYNKGRANFDVRHNWRFNALYHMPDAVKRQNIGAVILNGWWMSGIVSVESGRPFTPTLASNRSFSGNNVSLNNTIDRTDIVTSGSVAHVRACDPGYGCNPNAVAYDPASVIIGGTGLNNGPRWFNTNMFVNPPQGYLGTAIRNMLEGPGLRNVDFAINKDFRAKRLGEQGSVQFRWEVFNVFNHPNFSLPSASVYSGAAVTGANGATAAEQPLSTAALITSTATRSRQMQFALKVVF